MKHSEVSELLALIAANDRRTVGDADVLLWQQVLADTAPQDAADAVVWHAANVPGEWLTPAHVLQRIRQVHRQRLQDAGPCDYPSGMTLAQERNYRELWQEQVRCGATREQATVHADSIIGYRRGELMSRPVVQALEGMFSTRRAS